MCLWIPFAVLQVIIAVLMIVVIVLFTIMDDSETDEVRCHTHSIVTVSQSDDLKTTRIVYKSIVTALALAVAVFILVIGLIVFRSMTVVKQAGAGEYKVRIGLAGVFLLHLFI